MSVRHHVNRILQKLEKSFAVHNCIEVSRSAILHNVKLFEKLSGQPVIPVLKANAYGHGITLVAQALKGHRLPYVAVDGYFEALRIREVSKQPVLIMGAILPENYKRMTYDNFAFVVQDEASIRALGNTKKRVVVHLEVNTGMNRYGAQMDEITKLTKLILGYKNLTLEGVMSHLADSDGNDPATVEKAVERFDACIDAVKDAGGQPTMFHVAQSAGSLRTQSRYANTIRVGIGLYGINPFASEHSLHQQLRDLKPALQLVSTITQVINLQKGDKVSYNYTFTAPKDMKIGVLPLGYYEGVNRALSNTGFVKIVDEFTPIVGRVCMNHTMISLDEISAAVGDKVIVYSSNPQDKNSIDSIAQAHNLFNYNLLTSLSSDVRHKLVP